MTLAPCCYCCLRGLRADEACLPAAGHLLKPGWHATAAWLLEPACPPGALPRHHALACAPPHFLRPCRRAHPSPERGPAAPERGLRVPLCPRRARSEGDKADPHPHPNPTPTHPALPHTHAHAHTLEPGQAPGPNENHKTRALGTPATPGHTTAPTAGSKEDLGVVRTQPEAGMEGRGEAVVRVGPGVGMPGVAAMPKGAGSQVWCVRGPGGRSWRVA